MLSFLAVLGRAAAPFLLSLAPGISPRFVMVFAALLAILVAVGAPAGGVWLHMRGERKVAVVEERKACELSKEESARVSAETMAHLLDQIAKHEEEDDGRTPAEKCRADPFRKGKKK